MHRLIGNIGLLFLIAFMTTNPVTASSAELPLDIQREFSEKTFRIVENTWGPHQEITKRLPSNLFPVLPASYRWAREEKGCVVECYEDAPAHDIEFVVYGPDLSGKINYLTLVDGQNVQSFAHTRSPTFRGRGPSYTFQELITTSALEFRYNLRSQMRLGKRFLDGHCIDRADTISENPYNRGLDSNKDPKNHIPEPDNSNWGLNVRNHHVRYDLRAYGGSYMQLPYYGENPTQIDQRVPIYFGHSGGYKHVPEGVYFVDFDSQYHLTNCYDIPWDDPIHTTYTSYKTEMPARALPEWGLVPYLYDPAYGDYTSSFAEVVLLGLTRENKGISAKDISSIDLASLKEVKDLNHMQLYALQTASTNEVQSPLHKLFLTCYLSTRSTPKLAEAALWERRARFHAEFLDESDIKSSLITPTMFSNVKSLFDEEDSRYDFWRQIYSHQLERQGRIQVVPSSQLVSSILLSGSHYDTQLQQLLSTLGSQRRVAEVLAPYSSTHKLSQPRISEFLSGRGSDALRSAIKLAMDQYGSPPLG